LTERENYSDSLKDLLSTKLFSGGLENGCISRFSEKNKKNIKILQDFKGDELEFSEEIHIDPNLSSIIEPGTNNTVDSFIQLLVWNEQRQMKEGKEQSEEEIIIYRCAFASMLKLNELTREFNELINKFSLLLDGNKEKTEEQKFLEIVNQLENSEDFRKILRRWNSANKIKPWYSKKIQTVLEVVTKKEIDQIKKEKDENDKKEEEEEKKKGDSKEEEKKDDSSDKKNSQKDKEESKEEIPEEEEKEEVIDTANKDEKIQEIDQTKINKAVNNAKEIMVKAAIGKAKLLLELNIP